MEFSLEFSIAMIAMWLLALLLLAGDIEENPGPPKITRSQAAHLSQRVFQEFFSRVSSSIQGCLDRFAGDLLSENLIGWEAMKEVTETLGLTSTKKATLLLLAVQSKIASTKSDKPFRTLCRVMKNYAVLEDLTKEMIERFEYLCSNDRSDSDRSSDEEEPPTVAQRVDYHLPTLQREQPAPPAASAGFAPRNLTIKNLAEVKDSLGYFSDWNNLGLNLGLHPDLLDKIRKDKRDVDDRLEEVLRNWLQMKSMDREKEPTWNQLIAAVKPINCALSISIAKKHLV